MALTSQKWQKSCQVSSIFPEFGSCSVCVLSLREPEALWPSGLIIAVYVEIKPLPIESKMFILIRK